MAPSMLKMKIKESTMERVEVGKISEDMRLAEEEAGELNMNITMVNTK